MSDLINGDAGRLSYKGISVSCALECTCDFSYLETSVLLRMSGSNVNETEAKRGGKH